MSEIVSVMSLNSSRSNAVVNFLHIYLQQGVRGFRYSNWANTFSCEPELYFEPTNVDEIRQVM